MARWRVALFVAIAVPVLLAGCKSGGDSDNTPTAEPSPAATASPGPTEGATPGPTPVTTAVACDRNLEAPLGEIGWEDILPADIPAPEGWSVRDDPGEGPFVSVYEGDEAVGPIELLTFAHEPDFEPQQGLAALDDWSAEYYASISADRSAAGGPVFSVEPDPVAPVQFGEFCGIRYGFTGEEESGAPYERYAGAATFDSEHLYLVVTFFDRAVVAEGMGFRDIQTLRDYEPSFTELIESLNVPPLP